MGLPFTATGCRLGDGLTRRHDVVSFNLLCRERQENSPIYHYLCCCAGCSQHGYNRPDYCSVWTKPVSDGWYPPRSSRPILTSSQTNRVQYFHYMWTPLPEDGSVKCQSPTVQTTVGFVQGGMWNGHTSMQLKANCNPARVQHRHRLLPCRPRCCRAVAVLLADPPP